jgi:hypothetical protein
VTWKVIVIVFSIKSIGVGPSILLDFWDFWAGFEPYFLGVFLEAFLPFFGLLKSAFTRFLTPMK